MNDDLEERRKTSLLGAGAAAISAVLGFRHAARENENKTRKWISLGVGVAGIILTMANLFRFNKNIPKSSEVPVQDKDEEIGQHQNANKNQSIEHETEEHRKDWVHSVRLQNEQKDMGHKIG